MRCTRRQLGLGALAGFSSLAGCSALPLTDESNPPQAGWVAVENNHPFPHECAIRVTEPPKSEPIAETFSHATVAIPTDERKTLKRFLRWSGSYTVECRLLSGGSETSVKIKLRKRDGVVRGQNVRFRIGSGGEVTADTVPTLD